MQVETYEALETCGGEPENDSAAVELIGQLALEGQQKLISPDNQRNPYRHMTVEERNVYSMLLPSHDKLTSYDAGPIPLRVLQVAAHATNLGVFRRFEVWHSSGAEKDPVLVAHTGEYDTENFLLARWGEELEPFSVLAKKAAKIMRGKIASKLQSLKGRLDAAIAGLKDKTDEVLLSEKYNEPVMYYVD